MIISRMAKNCHKNHKNSKHPSARLDAEIDEPTLTKNHTYLHAHLDEKEIIEDLTSQMPD